MGRVEWSCTAFPLLSTQDKWHHQKRNLQVGDIVHLRYDQQFKNHFCLARVTQLFPNEAGVVRNVKVALKDHQTGLSGDLTNRGSGQILELTVTFKDFKFSWPFDSCK